MWRMSLRQFIEWFLPANGDSSTRLTRVARSGRTVVNTHELFKREDVREMFDSMETEHNGSRLVTISKK